MEDENLDIVYSENSAYDDFRKKVYANIDTIMSVIFSSYKDKMLESMQARRKKNLLLIAKLLGKHFSYMKTEENDVKIAHSISEEIHEEDTMEQLVRDPVFRETFLLSNWLPLPENITEIWDIADRINLRNKDVVWIIEALSKKIKTITLILPDGRHIKSNLPKETIERSMRFYGLTGSLDARLKELLRAITSKESRNNLEYCVRGRDLDNEDVEFLSLFIKNKPVSDPRFEEAINFLIAEISHKKNAKIYKRLEDKKFELYNLIESHRNYYDIVNAPRGEGEMSFDFERDVIIGGFKPPSGSPDRARKEIELIDYILGLDETSVPYLFDESVFEIGRRVAWRSKKIRTVYDLSLIHI